MEYSQSRLQMSQTQQKNYQYSAVETTDSSKPMLFNQINEMQKDYKQKPRKPDQIIPLRPSDFILLKKLGQGAYSSVYLVKEACGILWAMKVLNKVFYADEKNFNKLNTEIQIMKTVKSNQVMQLKYVFQSKTKIYIIMKFAACSDLHRQQKILKQLNSVQSTIISAEILQGLRMLQQNGVIYRDLKPENIMLNENGHVILADFGLSLMDQRVSNNNKFRSNNFCGTPEFMAPEVLLSIPYQKAIDVWSFGCVLYEICSGKGARTFAQHFESKRKFIKATLQNVIFFQKQIDPTIQEVISACLQIRQKDRPTIEQIMQMKAYQSIDWQKLADQQIPTRIPNNFSQDTLLLLQETQYIDKQQLTEQTLEKILINFPQDVLQKDLQLPQGQTSEKALLYQERFNQLCQQ